MKTKLLLALSGIILITVTALYFRVVPPDIIDLHATPSALMVNKGEAVINADKDFYGQNDGKQGIVLCWGNPPYLNGPQGTKVRILRSDTVSGPWTLVHEFPSGESDPSCAYDNVDGTTQAFYYTFQLIDGSGNIVYSSQPLTVPMTVATTEESHLYTNQNAGTLNHQKNLLTSATSTEVHLLDINFMFPNEWQSSQISKSSITFSFPVPTTITITKESSADFGSGEYDTHPIRNGLMWSGVSKDGLLRYGLELKDSPFTYEVNVQYEEKLLNTEQDSAFIKKISTILETASYLP